MSVWFAVPSCCGLNVQVNSTTPVSITIGWTRENCYKQNIREPQQYQVSYKLVGSSSIIASTNLDSHAIKFTASLLSPSNYYEFEVALEHQTGTETVPIIASTNTVNGMFLALSSLNCEMHVFEQIKTLIENNRKIKHHNGINNEKLVEI